MGQYLGGVAGGGSAQCGVRHALVTGTLSAERSSLSLRLPFSPMQIMPTRPRRSGALSRRFATAALSASSPSLAAVGIGAHLPARPPTRMPGTPASNLACGDDYVTIPPPAVFTTTLRHASAVHIRKGRSTGGFSAASCALTPVVFSPPSQGPLAAPSHGEDRA